MHPAVQPASARRPGRRAGRRQGAGHRRAPPEMYAFCWLLLALKLRTNAFSPFILFPFPKSLAFQLLSHAFSPFIPFQFPKSLAFLLLRHAFSPFLPIPPPKSSLAILCRAKSLVPQALCTRMRRTAAASSFQFLSSSSLCENACGYFLLLLLSFFLPFVLVLLPFGL